MGWDLARGINPKDQKQKTEKQKFLMFADFWKLFTEKYINEYHKPSTIKGDKSRIEKHIMPFFGAVCPEEKLAAAIIAPSANAFTMQLHLDEIALHIPEGKHGVIIMDQASWHLNKLLKIPKNISILHLPPYAPELNAQESVWRLLKERFFKNRVYGSAEEISQVASQAWNTWIKNPDEIASLSQRHWAKLY